MTESIDDQDRMGEYLDGMLPGPESAAFEKRLEQDASLRRQFELYRRTVNATRSLPKHALSEFGRARLRRALQQEQHRRTPLQRWLRPASYAAAAVLLMSVGFVTGQQMTASDSGVVQALPNPSPELRLRNANTGGWMNINDFASHVKRTRTNYAVIPQVRIPMDSAQPRLAEGRSKVEAALAQHQIDHQSVQFFAPVQLDENPLDGPEIEFWIQKVGVGTAAAAR